RTPVPFAACEPRRWSVRLGLGGVVRWRGIRLGGGLTLFALESVNLITQPLDLGLRGAQIGRHIFDQVQQPHDELAGPFIGDAAQVKVVKHVALESPDVGWETPLYTLYARAVREAACPPDLLRRYGGFPSTTPCSILGGSPIDGL